MQKAESRSDSLEEQIIKILHNNNLATAEIAKLLDQQSGSMKKLIFLHLFINNLDLTWVHTKGY